MSSYVLKPKVDVVMVTKKTRGKFPGEKAPVGTLGLVWSSWTSNSMFHTQKISLLTATGKVLFTTAKCTDLVGDITKFDDLYEAYKKYAELNFVPIFGFVRKPESKSEFIIVKFLSRDRIMTVPTSCVHYEDLDEIFESKKQDNFYCLRIEPWFLKARDLL